VDRDLGPPRVNLNFFILIFHFKYQNIEIGSITGRNIEFRNIKPLNKIYFANQNKAPLL